MMALLGAVTVSYASGDILGGFVESWRSAPDVGPIVVVENSPVAPALPPDVTLVHSATNLGYARGLEAGVRVLAQDLGGFVPEWLLLSNPDVTLVDGCSLAAVLSEVPETVGVVAPSIVDHRLRRELNPLMQTPDSPAKYVLLAALNAAGLLPYVMSLRRHVGSRARAGSSMAAESTTVFAPHGAAFFVRTSLALDAGILDHPQLLYGEESTLAVAASRAGVEVLFQPAIQLEHVGSTTISRAPSAEIRRLRTKGFLHTARLLRSHGRQ